MAVSITPGYDFSVNEVPKFSTVQQMATGLALSGLDIDNIAATLIGQIGGNVTGETGSSAPAEAWLWAAPDGSIFVKQFWNTAGVTDIVNTALWRPGGGWESSRFKQGDAFTVAEYAAGGIAQVRGVLPTANDPTSVFVTNDDAPLTTKAGFMGVFCKSLDTNVSGHHVCFVGRGDVPLYIASGAVLKDPNTFGYRHTRSGSASWDVHQNHTAVAGKRPWAALATGENPGATSSGANWTLTTRAYLLPTVRFGP